MASGYCGRPHEFGDPLTADHNGWHVGVGADDSRHDRGVGDPQPFDAVDAARRIDHGHRIVGGADGAGRGRMEAGASRVQDVVVRNRIGGLFSSAISRPGLIAAPIMARRSRAGADNTAVAPIALATPEKSDVVDQLERRHAAASDKFPQNIGAPPESSNRRSAWRTDMTMRLALERIGQEPLLDLRRHARIGRAQLDEAARQRRVQTSLRLAMRGPNGPRADAAGVIVKQVAAAWSPPRPGRKPLAGHDVMLRRRRACARRP